MGNAISILVDGTINRIVVQQMTFDLLRLLITLPYMFFVELTRFYTSFPYLSI